MGHQVASKPVFNYFQDTAVTNLVVGTPYSIASSLAANITELQIYNNTASTINLVVGTGSNQQTAIIIPPGVWTFQVTLHTGMAIYLNAYTATGGGYTGSITAGIVIINGFQ